MKASDIKISDEVKIESLVKEKQENIDISEKETVISDEIEVSQKQHHNNNEKLMP